MYVDENGFDEIMSDKMIWTEYLFNKFPIKKDSFVQQILARISLLLMVWVAGLILYMIDGLERTYLFNSQFFLNFFVTGFIILFGSYQIQRTLPGIISSFRTILRIDDSQFRDLSGKILSYSFSVIPCLLLGAAFTLILTDLPGEIQTAFMEGFRTHVVADVVLTFFMYLLVGTIIWLGVSIWLTVLLISRQPLNLDLTQNTIDKFRGLTMLAIWFSFFYFIATSIGIAINLIGAPAESILEILLSPMFFFIALGIIGVLFPFFNIHRALQHLKKDELMGIEDDYALLKKQLDEIISGRPDRPIGRQTDPGTSERTLSLIGQILSLQIKERNVRSAAEWPIDVSFLSKMLSLVLIPAIVRISVELLNRFYLR